MLIIFEINYESQPALTMAWYEPLSELMECKQKGGNCHVLKKYALIPKLGNWVCHERTQYNKTFINNERIMQLENVGFQWILIVS